MNHSPRYPFLLVLLVTCVVTANAQSNDLELEKTILHHDSLFWVAYNRCDVESMEKYFTNDLEFYHDKGGLTSTADSLFKSIRKGLCGSKDFQLRREVVAGSLRVFPMKGYGAILSGDHVFYVNEKGKKEYLDGLARFTHVWKLHNGQWKMHRVLSFDHRAADEHNLKAISKEVQARVVHAK